jgi:hypothetical protein
MEHFARTCKLPHPGGDALLLFTHGVRGFLLLSPFGIRYGSTLDPLACRGMQRGRAAGPLPSGGYYPAHLASRLKRPPVLPDGEDRTTLALASV